MTPNQQSWSVPHVSEEAVGDGRKMAEEIREYCARYRRENGLPSIEEEIAAWTWEPNDEWRKLRGILRDSKVDTTEQKHADRDWEIEHDKRKFGSVPEGSS